jgi:hypothetical protein
MPEVKKEDWLSPMNRLLWQKAFKSKVATVTLRDGRKFNLDYEKKNGFVSVTLADKSSYVPRGTFDLKKVTHSSWLSETNG